MQSARDHRTKATFDAQPDRTSPSRSLSEPTAGSLAGPNHTRLAEITTAINAVPSVQRRASLPPPNRTGLPDRLKSGIETLSGISLDTVRVHRNSAEPARLSAHAFARGTDIHLAPGQERHLPHEAWHVVQQAQGRVQPTINVNGEVPVNDEASLEREADVMGGRATNTMPLTATQLAVPARQVGFAQTEPPRPVSAVAQCLFVFQVNPDDYTIRDAAYHRVRGQFMTGNADGKHITADTVKDQTYNDVDGIGLDAMADRIIGAAATYMKLPGLDLLDAHYHYEDGIDVDAVMDQLPDHVLQPPTNGPIVANFTAFADVYDRLDSELEKLRGAKVVFENAADKLTKDAAAFQLQNRVMTAVRSLEMFRDQMPLVNMESGLQKRGKEPEANRFLRGEGPSGGIDSNRKALWALFDFAAIDAVADVEMGDEEAQAEQIRGALPWLSIDKLEGTTRREKAKETVTSRDIADYLSALMLANHVSLTRLSYPIQSASCNFATEASILSALNDHDSPVNRVWVANYAFNHLA